MRSGIAIGLALLLLVATPADAQIPPGGSVRIAASTGGNVNVRRTPEVVEGNVVGRAASGTVAVVTGAEERGAHVWYRVRLDEAGLEGWVRGDLVTAIGAPPAVEQEPATVAPDTAPGPPVADVQRPPAAAADWTRYILPLLPAVDSCLQIVTVKPARVTRVYELKREMAGVRVEDRSGLRWECLVGRAGGTPFRYEPLGTRVRPLVGDGNPIFVRAPGEPPDDPCWRTEEVRDPATDELLGWRSYKTC
ncbi:MAG TPA: SH3 domain-containing protein [Geminicoccaceae bacterium]|nr:SH3 domain-containing protein [Geminicoccaceae bacterium]